mgnify:CR=1 FL=1
MAGLVTRFGLPYHAALIVSLHKTPFWRLWLSSRPPFGADVIQSLFQFVPWMILAEEAGPEAVEPKPFLLQLMEIPVFPIAGILLIFYFSLIAPERRRKAEEAKRMAAITKNDRVNTAGGQHGTVVSAPPDSDVVTVRLDESGTLRVKVSRWAVTLDEAKSPKENE